MFYIKKKQRKENRTEDTNTNKKKILHTRKEKKETKNQMKNREKIRQNLRQIR